MAETGQIAGTAAFVERDLSDHVAPACHVKIYELAFLSLEITLFRLKAGEGMEYYNITVNDFTEVVHI